MKIGEDQARALVLARLGREPADFLESAVVLEAWGGLRAPTALKVAPTWRPEPNPAAEPARLRDRSEAPRRTGWVVVSTVLGTAIYLLVLQRHLPLSLVEDAWRVALPLALAWQWVARRRYVGGDRRLDGDRDLLGALAVVGLLLVACLGSESLMLSALILLPWCAAALVVGTPLAARYTAALGGGAALTLVMPTALLAMITPAIAAVLVGLHALQHRSGDPAPSPAPWRATLPATLPGLALGLLILAAPAGDGSISSLALIAALLPSLLGNHAAGVRLRRLWDVDAPPTSVVRQAFLISAVVTILGSISVLVVATAVSDVDLGRLATALAFLLLVALLTLPMVLLDVLRFDAALVSIGAATVVIMTLGHSPPWALAATVAAVVASAVLIARLLGDGIRLRAMP